MAFGSSNSSGFLTQFDLRTGSVLFLSNEVGDGVTHIAGSANKIVTLKSLVGNAIVSTLPAGAMSITVCSGATDVDVAPSGKIFVLCGLNNTMLIIENDVVVNTVALDIQTPIALAATANGLVYILSKDSETVLKYDIAADTFSSFKVRADANDIAAGASGDFYVTHGPSGGVSFFAGPSTGGGTLEQDLIQPATYGPVTRLADGFSAQITNYNPSNTYSVSVPVASGQLFFMGSDYFVKVSGLAPGQSATAFVTTTRDKENTGSGVSGSALEAALIPIFRDYTQTEDGFFFYIDNFNQDFVYVIRVDGRDYISPDDSGLVRITGLAPGETAIVDVTTTRSGYVDGTSSVSGMALESSTPAADDSASTSTSSTTSTTLDESMTTSSTSTTIDVASQPIPAATVTSGDTEVPVVPAAAIQQAVQATASSSTPVGVSVPAGTNEIVCDDACIDSLLTSVSATSGSVTASVGGAPAVELAKGTATKLQIGDKDTSIDFTVTPETGEPTVVNIPVVQAAGQAPTDAPSSGSKLWLLLLLLALLILLVLVLVTWRGRQNVAEDAKAP